MYQSTSGPRTFLALLLGGLLAAAGLVLGGLWYRRRRAQEALHSQFQGFRERAVGLMEQLDALRERHRTLADADPDYTIPMTGATLALFQAIEADLGRLWDRWLRVMDAWDRAQAMIRTGSAFRTREFEKARELLKQEGDFEEMTSEVESCRVRLDRLNQAHEKSRGALKAVAEQCATLRKTVDVLRASGLSFPSGLQEFGPIETLSSRAETITTADPIGAGEALAQANEALAALAGRLDRLRSEFARLEDIRRLIEGVARRAAELRSEGAALADEAVNPDPRLDQSRRLLDSALQALGDASPDTAHGLLDQARAVAEAAGAGIDRHLRARDAFVREWDARQAASARLDQAARQAEQAVADMLVHHARTSWNDVAGHLDAARVHLDAARERMAGAGRHAADGVQAFIPASVLLAEAAERHAKAEALLGALVKRHGALDALAVQVRERFRTFEGPLNQMLQFFERHRTALGREAERSREAVEAAYRALGEALTEARPDWPTLGAQAEALLRGLDVAMRQAEADVEGYRRTAERLQQVRDQARRVEALLAGEEKDRPPANQRYRAAVQALTEFKGDAEVDPGSWDRQLRQLEQISVDLGRAESMAGQDISVANAATAQIAAAARAIREARAYYESGIAVDVQPAEAQLSRARGSLATQAYEQAVEQANASEQLIRQAFDQAAYEARRRGMSEERGRALSVPDVLIIAAAQAAAQVAGRWLLDTVDPNKLLGRPGGWAAPGGNAEDAEAPPAAWPRADGPGDW